MGLHIVVLAGGSGTRLWPLSRRAVPKHLLPLGPGGKTLLRATVERVLPLTHQVHVVTLAAQAAACKTSLVGLDLPEDCIIEEPEARGTGPALGLATRWIARNDPDAVICSVHADAAIADDGAYRAAVLGAANWAEKTGGLATVGLVPTFPATGFGYVATGAPRNRGPTAPRQSSWSDIAPQLLDAADALPAYAASGFVEKPAAEVAAGFVRERSHLWNTGLFAWPAAALQGEIRAAAPEIDATLADVVDARGLGDERLVRDRYCTLSPVAIEPLVFERTSQLTVVAARFDWWDVGNWGDLLASRREGGEGDADGNVFQGDAIVLRTTDSFVSAEGGRLVAVVGLKGVVVVDTGDAVLVMDASHAQGVREVVTIVQAQGRESLL